MVQKMLLREKLASLHVCMTLDASPLQAGIEYRREVMPCKVTYL